MQYRQLIKHVLFLLAICAPLFGNYDLGELKSLYEHRSPATGFLRANFITSLGQGSLEVGKIRMNSSPLVVPIKKNYLDFCEAARRNKRISPESIPKKLHFIWLGSPLTELRYLILDSWKKFHPDWEFCVWTDSSLSDFDWPDDRLRELYETA